MISQNLSHSIKLKCVGASVVTEPTRRHSFLSLLTVTQKNHGLAQDGRGPGVDADQSADHEGKRGISLVIINRANK